MAGEERLRRTARSRQGRAVVDDAYEDCLERLCRSYAGTVAVGSHDPRLIDRAIALAGEYASSLEFQMLMSVRGPPSGSWRGTGRSSSTFYGGRWLSYFSRRVAERRENLAFALRAVTGLRT